MKLSFSKNKKLNYSRKFNIYSVWRGIFFHIILKILNLYQIQLSSSLYVIHTDTFFYNGCRYSRARAIVNKVKADKNNQHVIYIATLSNPHNFAEKILSWKTIANFWTMDRDDFPNFRSVNLGTFLKKSFITYRFYTIHICTWVNTR